MTTNNNNKNVSYSSIEDVLDFTFGHKPGKMCYINNLIMFETVGRKEKEEKEQNKGISIGFTNRQWTINAKMLPPGSILLYLGFDNYNWSLSKKNSGFELKFMNLNSIDYYSDDINDLLSGTKQKTIKTKKLGPQPPQILYYSLDLWVKSALEVGSLVTKRKNKEKNISGNNVETVYNPKYLESYLNYGTDKEFEKNWPSMPLCSDSLGQLFNIISFNFKKYNPLVDPTVEEKAKEAGRLYGEQLKWIDNQPAYYNLNNNNNAVTTTITTNNNNTTTSNNNSNVVVTKQKNQ